jgi:hypothetical protein
VVRFNYIPSRDRNFSSCVHFGKPIKEHNFINIQQKFSFFILYFSRTRCLEFPFMERNLFIVNLVTPSAARNMKRRMAGGLLDNEWETICR